MRSDVERALSSCGDHIIQSNSSRVAALTTVLSLPRTMTKFSNSCGRLTMDPSGSDLVRPASTSALRRVRKVKRGRDAIPWPCPREREKQPEVWKPIIEEGAGRGISALHRARKEKGKERRRASQRFITRKRRKGKKGKERADLRLRHDQDPFPSSLLRTHPASVSRPPCLGQSRSVPRRRRRLDRGS
jgi:hypothetical protein